MAESCCQTRKSKSTTRYYQNSHCLNFPFLESVRTKKKLCEKKKKKKKRHLYYKVYLVVHKGKNKMSFCWIFASWNFERIRPNTPNAFPASTHKDKNRRPQPRHSINHCNCKYNYIYMNRCIVQYILSSIGVGGNGAFIGVDSVAESIDEHKRELRGGYIPGFT